LLSDDDDFTIERRLRAGITIILRCGAKLKFEWVQRLETTVDFSLTKTNSNNDELIHNTFKDSM